MTALLLRLKNCINDDRHAIESQLMRILEKPLHELATKYFRRERKADPLLQPPLLAHDAFLELVRAGQLQPRNRGEFFRYAVRTIRNNLVDHARKRKARDGMRAHVSVEDYEVGVERAPDLVALDDALAALAELDPRQARIVELRFFGVEIAEELSVSVTTVKREWRTARVWLRRELSHPGAT